MSTAPGRVICAQCGANNFSTQANCWKCQAALGVSAAPRPPLPAPLPQIGVAPSLADPSVAFWAAIALAVFFPTVAVPVGIVFLMLDDRRKIEIGKLALIWGLIFSLLQFLVTYWIFREAIGQLQGAIPMIGRLTGGASAAQEPGMNDKVEPLTIPGETHTPENVPFPEPPKP